MKIEYIKNKIHTCAARLTILPQIHKWKVTSLFHVINSYCLPCTHNDMDIHFKSKLYTHSLKEVKLYVKINFIASCNLQCNNLDCYIGAQSMSVLCILILMIMIIHLYAVT